MTVSQLHKARYAYIPRFPAILDEPIESIAMQKEQETASIANAEEISRRICEYFTAYIRKFHCAYTEVLRPIYERFLGYFERKG